MRLKSIKFQLSSTFHLSHGRYNIPPRLIKLVMGFLVGKELTIVFALLSNH